MGKIKRTASKAKKQAQLVANKRTREFPQANNNIKRMKDSLKTAEKSARKKKTDYQKAFEKIQKADVFSYLTLINVRKGCSFGLTGKNPMIIFKLT